MRLAIRFFLSNNIVSVYRFHGDKNENRYWGQLSLSPYICEKCCFVIEYCQVVYNGA